MEVDRSRSVNSLNQRSCTSGTTLVEMNNRCSFASVAVLPREKVRRRVTKVVVAPMIVRLQRFRHVFTWRSCHGNDSRGGDERFVRISSMKRATFRRTRVRFATRVDRLALESWRVQGGKRGASSLNMHTGDVPFPF